MCGAGTPARDCLGFEKLPEIRVARRQIGFRVLLVVRFRGQECPRHTGSYFFSPAVKFVTTVTDWLTCCETWSIRNFLPSGLAS